MNLFIQLVICVAVAFSYIEATSEKLDKDFDPWPRSGSPASGSPASGSIPPVAPELCRKDILLILDMSTSIGSSGFTKMKAFLKSFIQNERLDVQPSGTQLAMIIFSKCNVQKTRVMFRFGEKTEQNDLVTHIDQMSFNALKGDRTCTGLALELGETQIFKTSSPKNARSTIPDVIILITDGKPNGRVKYDRYGREIKDETDLVKEAATRLKDNGVLIVSILVGNVNDRSRDAVTARQVLKDVASKPSLMFPVQITSIQSIMGKLLDASCNIIQEGDCQCVASGSNPVAPKYLPHDQTKATVQWSEPTVTCTNNKKPNFKGKIVTPTGITSPHSFDVGQHTIKYTYIFKGGFQLVCQVDIDVKIIPCGKNDYTPASQICCCGKVRDIMVNHQCCGFDYYDVSTKKCCGQPYFSLVKKMDVCPGA